MQVDFYQLSRDPVERVVPLLADKALAAGARLVIVDGDGARRESLSEGLWRYERGFLAHGDGEGGHDERQPILLAEKVVTSNAPTLSIFADGLWRDEATSLDRAILIFAPDQTADARKLWTKLTGEGHQLRIFKQGESGRWNEGR